MQYIKQQNNWNPNKDWLLMSTDDDNEETPNMQPFWQSQCDLSGLIFSLVNKDCNKSQDICCTLEYF